MKATSMKGFIAIAIGVVVAFIALLVMGALALEAVISRGVVMPVSFLFSYISFFTVFFGIYLSLFSISLNFCNNVLSSNS